MANRVNLNVSLTPELNDFVTSRVDSGRYLSASEVVREGLRLLQEKDLAREDSIQRLQEDIQGGLNSLDRDGSVPDEEAVEALIRKIEGGVG